MQQATDIELVERIQQGDQEAWAVFLARHTDLIYSKARQYSRPAGPDGPSREDETAELYLFMAESVRRSMRSFQGRCKASTWVLSVIGNRQHVLKAFLLQQRPDTAELRIPKILASRSDIDKEIFKRLVWGLEPMHIAQDLDIAASHCAEIEDLLAQHSSRVWNRICANRQSRSPHLRLDDWDAIADSGPDPASDFTARAWQHLLADALAASGQILLPSERRVLLLLYNHEVKASEIVQRAKADPALGLDDIDDVNRVYYLKDRSLDKIMTHILALLKERTGQVLADNVKRRDLLKHLAELLRQHGIPPERT